METGMRDVVRRWLLHISTYDVEIEYRPGRLYGNADGLSHPPIIEDCQARGCICAQAHENLAQDDGEPDFESHPGIEAVPTTLIAAITRSGLNTIPEPPAGESKEDVEILEPPPPGFRHADMRPSGTPQDEDDSGSSCSDMETEIGAEEDILADIAPVGVWCSPAMRELQSDDVEIARVRAWVENGTRPPAIDLEAEGQGVKSMIVLWEELAIYNGVIVHEQKSVKAVVLLKKIRADVFRHLHLANGGRTHGTRQDLPPRQKSSLVARLSSGCI
jgi:hypothetical protein